jgi:hypothetical protein
MATAMMEVYPDFMSGKRWALLRRSALVALGFASVGCHHYSPVERHFLRVPAQHAASLSGIEREKWLKQAGKDPGWKEQAVAGNYLALKATSRPSKVHSPEGEVRFFPTKPGGREGAVALHWLPEHALNPSTLSLLKTEGGRYQEQSLKALLKTDPPFDFYSLRAEPGAIVCYRRVMEQQGVVLKKAAVFRWQKGRWIQVQRPSFP